MACAIAIAFLSNSDPLKQPNLVKLYINRLGLCSCDCSNQGAQACVQLIRISFSESSWQKLSVSAISAIRQGLA